MRLELRDITKRFPGVLANDRISISADRGKVLGMLGENGAGKTTLMNILSGLYKPDSGQIFIDGEERVFGDPVAAIRAGVGMVHQHFMLVPVFDVIEAVALGAETVKDFLGTFDRGAARARIVELSEQYKLGVDPDARIESLPVGVRQRVEILKSLYRQSDILVLDEPSAVLTPHETRELYGIIRSLAKGGTTVIFITHKLNEVLEVADDIVVLRRGRVAGTADPKTATRQELANLMVGRDVELIVPKEPAKPGEIVLHVEALQVRDNRLEMAVKGVDLDVRSGEIVVIAGVQGNGQTELVEALTGLRAVDSGEITIGGHHTEKSSPRQVSDLGVAHIPEDRGRDGLISEMSVAENYILDSYHKAPYSKRGIFDLEAVRERAAQGVKDFDVRTPSIDTFAGSLSGGNQQKVVVAREFSVPVQLVIAAQPTRGLDVGSIEYIHRHLVEQRDAGAAILIVSTELDEVLAVGDRIAVMFDGRIVGILDGDDATYENLGLLMGGASFGGGVAA
jgi:general nucleoside transport system ATP-binding protein